MSARPKPAAMQSTSTAAVLLAAGMSERMGGINKLLLEIGGEPMVRRAACTLLACGLDLFVVVGHARARVEATLAGLDTQIVFNPDYRDGQPSSVRAGIAALSGRYGSALIALSDQPLLEPSDIETLTTAFAASDQTKILMPVFEGRRGNPIIVPAEILEDIGSGATNFGCRKFMDRNPERIMRFEATNDHYTSDVDTPEAFTALGAGAAIQAATN